MRKPWWWRFILPAGVLTGLVLLCVLGGLVGPILRGLVGGRGPAVAVMKMEGVISSAGGGLLSGAGVQPEQVAKRVEELIADPDVRAVVIRINSPGGGVVASDEIRKSISKLREAKKPVVASLAEVAASGGYYIASGSDWIVANPQSITGSIGVIATVPIVRGLLDRIGVDVEIVRSGPLKGSGSGVNPLGDEERAVLQGLVDDAYQQFVSIVAGGRKMDRDRVIQLADGRIYNGSQAKSLGLVDEIGDLEQAIDRAAALAKISGKPRLIEERRPSFIEELFSSGAIGRPLPSGALGFTADPGAPLQYLYIGPGS